MTNTLFAEDQSADFLTYRQTAYEAVLHAAGDNEARLLDRHAEDLAEAIRHAADRNLDPGLPGKLADNWLLTNFGRVDDPARRAVVGALARVLEPDERLLPRSILELYPAVHMRLARFLAGAHTYNDDLFAKDVAMASGATAPMGPLTIFVPRPGSPRLA